MNDEGALHAGNELQGIEDMIHLDIMSEETILKNLQVRYSKDLIYTYTGSILVSINPYQILPIYTAEVARKYDNQHLGIAPPHVFAIAEDAYHTMLDDGGNKSIIISGESGAGKTEATKLMLQYLALKTGGLKTLGPEKKKKTSLVEQLILESSPILEAFGNAKTVRNDNSSRFGKYINIQFDARGMICGAKIENYLLEKSRIVYQATDERNYHVFYNLCAGATEEERERWKVGKAESFHYLNQSGCIKINGVDDANDFRTIKHALRLLEIEPDGIFQTIAAILHIGNIVFAPAAEGSKIANQDSLDIAAALLEVPPQKLAEALTVRFNEIKGEVFRVPLKPEESADVRDATAKALYGRQFDWLVQQINQSILKSKTTESKSFIGVLDIFGFENFAVNSFEQFCINYTNEKLQQQFNQHIFKQEQEEYEREKIDWTSIEFNDNQGCIDLIEKKLGILALLDEECRFPKASDETFLQKLHDNWGGKPYYEKPKRRGNFFVVKHYAGEVNYTVDGFLEKNRDTIPDGVSSMLAASGCIHVRQLFSDNTPPAASPAASPAPAGAAGGGASPAPGGPAQPSPAGRAGPGVVPPRGRGIVTRPATVVKGKPAPGPGAASPSATMRGAAPARPTVGNQFKEQLLHLVETLGNTYPYYVRCIKPNTAKKPSFFDQELVLAQLRYCGMLETIRIRKLGFPIRREFKAFFERYRVLAPHASGANVRDACKVILSVVGRELTQGHFCLGLTKVFLRDEQSGKLEELRNKQLTKSVILLQKTWRGYHYRARFRRLKKATLLAQALFRGRRQRIRYDRMREAAITLESCMRMSRARKRFLAVREGVLAAQACVRTFAAVKERERLAHEEAERQRRLEEIRKLKDKEERARREKEEAERAKREAEERDRQKRQEEDEKKARELQKQREEETRRRDEERKRAEEAMQRMASVVGTNDIKNIEHMIAKPADPAALPSYLPVPSDLPPPPDEWDELPPPSMLGALPPVPGQPAPPTSSAPAPQQENIGVVYDYLYTALTGYSYKDYAAKNFRTYKKETVASRLAYSKKPLTASLLDLDEESNKLACELSRKIWSYVHSGKGLKEHLPTIRFILQQGVGSVDGTTAKRRDEIYCQVLKSIIDNPSATHSLRSWILLSFCACSFPPSPVLARYLQSFLDENTKQGDYVAAATYVLQCLKRMGVTGARKFVPSWMELEAIEKREPMVIRIFFLDGSVKAVFVDSATTIAEMKASVVTKIRMQHPKGFSLFKSYNQIERVMDDDDKMGDQLAQFETLRDAMFEKGVELKLRVVFMKRLFFHNVTTPIEQYDKTTLDLLFVQATEDIRTGRLPTTREVVLKLAGLKCQSDIGDWNGEPLLPDIMIRYIPAYLRYKFQDEDWPKCVEAEYKIQTGRTTEEVRINYMQVVMQLPLYGCALYPVKLVNNVINLVRDEGYIAISGSGLCFVTRDQQGEVVMTSFLPFGDVYDYEANASNNTLNITVNINDKREVLEMISDQAVEAEKMMKDYCDQLCTESNYGRVLLDYDVDDESLLPLRQGDVVVITEKNDATGWYRGTCNGKEGAFPADIIKMMVAPPKPGTRQPVGSTYLTVRRSDATTNRMTAARDPDMGKAGRSVAPRSSRQTSTFRTVTKRTGILSSKKEELSMKELMSFSKDPIKESLIRLPPEHSKAAKEMFVDVMRYMGDYPSKRRKSKAILIHIIQQTIDNRELRDELYCQLLKQISNNPREKSLQKGWELLALAAGCVQPQDQMLDRVFDKLSETEEKVEGPVGQLAKAATERLQNSILAGERELAPSDMEVEALRQKARMVCRVGLPDGSYKSVLVDAWTTIKDLIPQLARLARLG